MSPTVHELRNRIRSAVGRFEREVDAQFTKEELAAIADAVGADADDRRPSKEVTRTAIRREVEAFDGEPSGAPFVKAGLERIDAVLAAD